MNWLFSHLIKEARGRRFRTEDRIRYFTENRKGKGQGLVLTPSFSKGTVVNYDTDSRRYKVRNDQDEIIDVHPRNIIPDSIVQRPISSPVLTEPVVETPELTEPFVR